MNESSLSWDGKMFPVSCMVVTEVLHDEQQWTGLKATPQSKHGSSRWTLFKPTLGLKVVQ